ncbi:hypothetical protein RCL1_008340 [Eukaryota sp. TZLM3-RCL]
MYRFTLAPSSLATPSVSTEDTSLEQDLHDKFSTSFLPDVNKRVLVVLKPNRYVIGTLTSFSPSLDIVLQNAYERFFVDNYYADVYLGFSLFRGANLLLLSQIDDAMEVPSTHVKVDEMTIKNMIEAKGLVKEIVEEEFD